MDIYLLKSPLFLPHQKLPAMTWTTRVRQLHYQSCFECWTIIIFFFFLAMDYNHLQLHVNVNASLFID